MKNVNIRIGSAEKAELLSLCEALDLSLSQVFRVWIDRFLKEK